MQDYHDIKKLKNGYINKNKQLDIAIDGDNNTESYEQLSLNVSGAEKEYRIAKSKAFVRLRFEDNPVTLIPAIAAGDTAEKRYAFKAAEGIFHARRESIKRLHANIDAYRSLLSTAKREMDIR